MALVSCSECGMSMSDRAAACPHCGAPNSQPTGSQPASQTQAPTKRGSLWKWVLGIPLFIFLFVMIVGTIVGSSPEAQERAKDRDKIDACWGLQGKKSIDPSAARLAAGLCERLEDDFRRKHRMSP